MTKAKSASQYHDVACKGCGELMAGINTYKLRTTCQECGGNRTQYNRDNPHPECTVVNNGL